LSKVDEIRYPFGLMSFAIERATEDLFHKHIIEITNLENIEHFSYESMQSLLEENPNLYYDIYRWQDFIDINENITIDTPRFLYHMPITTYAELHFLLSFPGCYGITIGEPLTFDLKEVYYTVHYDDARLITLRCYPAIGRPSQFNYNKNDSGINHFWILPQHVKLFEGYIDILDLVDSDILREKQLVHYYVEEKEFLLGIDLFFKNMDCKMIGNFVTEEWMRKRINCRQTCFLEGFHCRRCLREQDLYNTAKRHPELLKPLKRGNNNGE